MVALLAFGILFQYDYLLDIIQFNFTGTAQGVPTNLQNTLTFGSVIRGYMDADIFSYAFGNYLMGSQAVLKIGASSFSGELRGLGMPLSFGFGWTLIMVSGMATMARYSYFLIKTKSTESQFFEVFGLAFLGLLIVYAADIHYPKWNTHGALELFMVAAGTLSSLREASRRNMRPEQEMLPSQELQLSAPQ